MKKVLMFIILVIVAFSMSGCTKMLKNDEGKPVINKETGQNLTENILCRPEDQTTIDIYKKNNINVNSLQECKKFSITTGGYEGVWTTIFVKPLVWILIQIELLVKNYGLSIIIITLAIRLLLMPITKKTALQSENMKKVKPELDKLEKKYQGRKDNDSAMQKSQEMLALYKKYNISPLSGCLFSFIQIPLFLAFFEAMNRLPVIFEEKFLSFQLGTSPMTAFANNQYQYLIIIVLVFLTTYFSFKLNSGATMSPEQANQMKFMMKFLLAFILIISFSISAGIALYWIVNSGFTILQNILVKRSKKNEIIKV
ncbi:MAG: membrane protein insertase YidC [Ignavibacteriales bacterium]